jgi:hypothetical protein
MEILKWIVFWLIKNMKLWRLTSNRFIQEAENNFDIFVEARIKDGWEYSDKNPGPDIWDEKKHFLIYNKSPKGREAFFWNDIPF